MGKHEKRTRSSGSSHPKSTGQTRGAPSRPGSSAKAKVDRADLGSLQKKASRQGQAKEESVVQEWRPSNETGHYDEARVAQLKTIRVAIQKLGLPLIRFRKLGGVLNAIEMQIEDGGDSPEVNGLLLAALRAGIRHQVEDSWDREALLAIDAFERAEARRWEQMRAGRLPPIKLTEEQEVDDLIHEGYEWLQARQTTVACDRWLAAWEIVKHLARPEVRSAEAFDDAYPGLVEKVFNWSSDLEMELGNAGLDASVYHEHRLRYAREFLALFPAEDANRYVSMMRAQGEALWRLGRRPEADAVYAALVERLPDEGWAYIGWSDNYWVFNDSPKEYDTGEAILQRALARPTIQDRDDVLERLRDLQDERAHGRRRG